MTNKTQFSVRSILIATVIVALGVALYFQSAERARLASQLDGLVPSVHIWIWPDRTNSLISTTSSLSQGCNVLMPRGYSSEDEHVFQVELREAATQEVVASDEIVNANLDGNGNYSFSFTLNYKKGRPWSPGLHVLRVTMLEGQKALTRSSLEMQMVDRTKSTAPSATKEFRKTKD